METVIKVDNLSKQYRLGSGDTGYKTFRETIVDAAKAPLVRLSGAMSKALKAKRLGSDSMPHALSSARSSHSDDLIWALKDVSFEVKRGEVVGIIGRNGAGKSTILKILSKITEPTEGRVELKGHVGSLLEVGTGFHPELTGHENIYLYGAILGMNRWEVTRKFDEIVAFAEVEKFIDTPIKRYSSGMYMRLAFAVAAHMDPEILLVDEVLAVGDIGFQKKCLGKMEGVANEGKTVLFVSHNMEVINQICERGILLEIGNLIKSGKMSRISSYYVERHIESSQPSQSFLPSQDKEITFLEASVVDKNYNIKKQFNIFEEINICLKYMVNQSIRASNIALIVKWNNHTVFITYDTDHQTTLLDMREQGVYEAIFKMPTELMKTGHYSISLVAGRMGVGIIHEMKDILFFKIVQNKSELISKSYYEKREGVIVCQGKWETKKLVNHSMNT
jgi:lipopolysaccharide transport system ATP-binding protein